MVTTGYYINVFKVRGVDDAGIGHYFYDMYIILNEPNDLPTPEEVTKIEEAVDKMDSSDAEIESKVSKVINDLGLNCTKYGFRITYYPVA